MDTVRRDQCFHEVSELRTSQAQNDNDFDLSLPAVVLSPAELATFVVALRSAWGTRTPSSAEELNPILSKRASRILAIALLREMPFASDSLTLVERALDRIDARRATGAA